MPSLTPYPHPQTMHNSPCVQRAALSFKRLLPLTLTTALLSLTPVLHAATVTNWTNPAAGGNWSDPSKWDNGLPNLADSVANFAVGSSALATVVDASAWSLEGITASITSNVSLGISGISAGTALSIGSGGIALSSTLGQINMGGVWWQTQWTQTTLNAVADQTWSTNNANGGGGGLKINAALTGSSVITLQALNPDWQTGVIEFAGGSSSAFTGSFVLKSAEVRLSNNGSFAGGSQLGRLGVNAMKWQNDTTFIDPYGTITKNALRLYTSGTNNTAETFSTPIQFEKKGGASRYLSFYSAGSAAVTGKPGRHRNLVRQPFQHRNVHLLRRDQDRHDRRFADSGKPEGRQRGRLH